MSGTAEPIVSLSEAQAYVRIETGEEEALVAGLIRSASALCEAFINQVVVARPFTLQLPASGCWERLATTPVRAITQVLGLDGSGTEVPLAADAYTVDIDFNGDGWVRTSGASGVAVVQVGGTAGMADDENGVPEPIRQGVLRLVSHLFTSRDGEGGDIPAAVTALWRPFRRMRIA
jgi:uncharacterized phiE125 gp8 family phage protein